MLLLPDVFTLTTYYQMGGFVMLPLLLVAVLLWYALAYRFLVVSASDASPRKLIQDARKDKIKSRAITAQAARLAIAEAQVASSRKQLKSVLNERFQQFKAEINQYRFLVRSLVAVAPLLGLLGTVDGMIVTFNSLGDMALFSQSGGIAAGISRALFTTQMGLAISIPGLLIGRMIDHKQVTINRELDQIRDLVCTGNSNG